MKKLAMLLLLFLTLTTRAQNIPASANITAQDSGACSTAGACLTVNVPGSAAASVVQITGTFSATLQFEGTTSVGGTFVSINATPVGGSTAVTSTTSTGAWRITASGLAQLRVRCSTFSSGPAVVAITLSSGSSGSSSAGSGGTVTAVTGTAPIASSGGTTPAISCASCFTSSAPPTLDQIGDPAASKIFSLGSNFPFGSSAPGLFTVAANRYYNTFTLTGGGTCSPNAIMNGDNAPSTVVNTDALTGCVSIPSGSGNVTNRFSDAIGGYALNNNSSQQGQGGNPAEVVGVYGVSFCAASNSFCEGVVAQAVNQTGTTSTKLFGFESDVGTNDSSTNGFAYYANFSGSGQPTGDRFPAFYASTPAGSGTFTSGFECQQGATNSANNFSCFISGPRAAGTSQASQFFFHNAVDINNVAISNGTTFLAQRVLQLGLYPTVILSVAGGDTEPSAYAIGLTSTSALTQNQLVKTDSAHADSVVVCTTTDTLCLGFVVGITSGAGALNLCAAASPACPIAMTPGNLIKAIMGTGTCAIGNWVIVDTTTNGDVKCTATQPAAWQGFAYAANSSVGTAFDVLISPGGTLAGGTTAKTFSTSSNCSSSASPAVCGSAAAGSVAVPTGTNATLTVNTTAVTANSQIFVQSDDTLGTKLGVTCNTTLASLIVEPVVSARTGGTSFQITISGTTTTNPVCLSYFIVN